VLRSTGVFGKKFLWTLLVVFVSIALTGSPAIDSWDTSCFECFHFARVRFNEGGRFYRSGWAHDYPRAEQNFLKILAEVTGIGTKPDSYLVVDLDDPRIMEYPILYFSEPGGWYVTEEEAANLRQYFLRGGFAIFDDFDGPRQWAVFTSSINRVLPERQLQRLTVDHPIFHSFYDIETLDMVAPFNYGYPTEFWGIHDENNRLQVIVNFNNDIGDYWEWSDSSLVPVPLSNEAYKLGVNYVIYALTH